MVKAQMGVAVANTAGTGGITITVGDGTSNKTLSLSGVATNGTAAANFSSGVGVFDYTTGQTFSIATTTSATFTGTPQINYTVVATRIR